MTAFYFLGLDPGMDGAAVILCEGGMSLPGDVPEAILFRDFLIPAPSRGRQYDHGRLAEALRTFVGDFVDPLVVLEQGRGQPGASSSSLAIGVGFGLLLGIIAANRWKVVIVQPATWHRKLFGKNAAGDPKARAAAFVRDRYPLADPTCLGRFRKPHPGVIDALCLAHYGTIVGGSE